MRSFVEGKIGDSWVFVERLPTSALGGKSMTLPMWKMMKRHGWKLVVAIAPGGAELLVVAWRRVG